MRSGLTPSLYWQIVSKTPDLIPFLTRSLWRKHIEIDTIDYRKATGRAYRPPLQVSLRITNACNHRCAVCGQYGEKGYMHGEKKHELLKTLPVESYLKMIDDLSYYNPLYYVTGGEAFLYHDLMAVLNYAKKKGATINVVTNGVKLKESAREIVENNWDMVLVSFDGPEEIHDKCRGYRGAFKTAVDGLHELNFWKNKLNKKKPYILTSTTLSSANVDYLADTFDIGKSIMPDLMVLYLSWFTSEALGNAQKRLYKDRLNIEAYTWESYVRAFNDSEAENFQTSIESVENMKWPFKYFILPNLRGNDIKEYYMHPEKAFGYEKCVAPFLMVDIMPNGDVVTCRDYIDVKVGNITEDKLLNIWNNERYIEFRKLLIEKRGLMPQCIRCCGLMGF